MKRLLNVLLVMLLCVPTVGRLSLDASTKVLTKEEASERRSGIEKQQLPEKVGPWFFMRYGDKKFVVSAAVLNQFELYQAQARSGQTFADKETVREMETEKTIPILKRSASMVELESLPVKQGKQEIRQETPRDVVVWDITEIIDEEFLSRKEKVELFREKMPEYLVKEFYAASADGNAEAIRALMRLPKFRLIVRQRVQEDGIDPEALVGQMIDVASGAPIRTQDNDELFMIIKIADHLGNKKVMERCTPVLMERLMVGNPLPNFVRTLTAPQGMEHTMDVSSVVYIPGTHLVVSGSFDRTLKVWDYETGLLVRTLTAPQGMGHTNWVSSVVSIPGTHLVVSGSWDNTLKVWDYETGLLVRTLTAPQGMEHRDFVTSMAYIPGMHLVVSGSSEGTLKVWDYETGHLVRNLTALQGTGHTDTVMSVVYIPGTPFVVSGSEDKTLKVWDYETGLLVRTLTAPQGMGHTNWVWSVVSIPGTHLVVSGSEDKTLKVWDYETGLFVRNLTAPQGMGHTNGVRSVASIPGTHLVVSGSDDNTLKVWDYVTGQLVRTLTEPQGMRHTDVVRSVVSIPGTHFVVSGSFDRTLKVWDIDTFASLADLNFAQVALCYWIFTSREPVELMEGSEGHHVFMDLPQNLQDHMLRLKKVKIVGPSIFSRIGKWFLKGPEQKK